MHRIKQVIQQVFRFSIVGVIAFIIDYCCLLFSAEVLNINYLASAAIAFSVAALSNYFLSKKWVFFYKKKLNKVFEIMVFIALSIVGLLLNQLFMWIFTDKLFIDYRISKIFAVVIVMVWNFFSRKRFLENPKQK